MLVEAGEWVLNLRYLISSRKVGDPDPRSEVTVMMERGDEIRLSNHAAAAFLEHLDRLVTTNQQVSPMVTPTRVQIGRGDPG